MRNLYVPFFLFCFLGMVRAVAQVNFTEILTELPACSIDCVLKGLSSVPDALTDPTKTCTNITLQASLSACIQKQCNYTEQARVAIVDNQLCEGVPIQSRAWGVAIVGLVCGPLALIAIALRCYSRYSITRSLGWDDWLAVVTGLVLIPLIVLDCYNGIVNGYGRHYWDVDPLRVVELLKIFYVAEILYIVVITLVKASILALYFRVFLSNNFRIAAGIVLVLVVFSGLGVIAAIVFQCSPVDLAWDRTIVGGRCINVNELAYAAGAISVALDIIILVLPLPELYHLQMSKKKKLNVMFMFSLGTIACITSIVRLKYLVDFAKSTDPTWDNAIPVIWSFLEICVAIICACLPAIRAILSRYLPSVFAFTWDYSHDPRNSKDQKGSNPSHPSTAPSPSLVLQTSSSRPRSGGSKGGFTTAESKLLSPTSPNFSNFTYNLSQGVDLESGNGGSVRRSSSAMGENGTLKQVWINPKFDREGNILDYQKRTSRDDDDDDDASENFFKLGSGSRGGRSSETSVWIVEGPRESEEQSDGHSDAILELRDPPKGLVARNSVQMGTFGRLRGGEGRERWRDRFMPKVQRLLTPLPLGTDKTGIAR